MHGGSSDAADGPARRHARPRGPHHRQQSSRSLSAQLGETAVPRAAPERAAPERAVVAGLHRRRDLAGFVYVASITHAYARRIVGWRIVSWRIVSWRIVSWRIVSWRIVSWRIRRTAHAALVLDALEQALADRRPVQGGCPCPS